MLGAYLNQISEWNPKTGTDDRGKPIYGPGTSIPCRHMNKTQNVLTPTGQAIKTEHVYYAKQKISEGDTLDSKIIMLVTDWVWLDGSIVGYKAVV